MTVESATCDVSDGYPILVLMIDGRRAVLDAYPSPSLAEAGIHYLGPKFEDVVPPIEYRPDDGSPETLLGFTADPVVHRLWLAFSGADPFVPGPLAIPAP